MSDKKIFISYSWKQIKVVDKIDKDFESIGINLIRDIRGVGAYKSIKTFMQRISTADYVLMIISDGYLKSKNCMYEVLELLKDTDYIKKILPIFLEDLNDIYNIPGKSYYLKFWEDALMANEESLKAVSPVNSKRLYEDLKVIRDVSENIIEFLDDITDMNHTSLNKLKEENYKTILDHIGYDENSIESELLKIRLINNVENQDLAIKKLQEKHDKNSKFFFFRGKFEYEIKRNYIKANTYYTKAINLNPNDFMAYNNRGASKAALGQNEKAILDFTDAINLNPDDFIGYYNRGHSKADLGQNEEAILDYTDAIKLNQDDFRAYDNRGIAKAALGRNEEAILDFTEGINLNPGNYTAYNNRGIAKADLGQNEEAILDYTEAISLDPDFFIAYHNRGIAKTVLGQNEEAILDYTEVINLNPDFFMAYYNRGVAKAVLGKYEEAILDFTDAINLNKEAIRAYHNRGRVKAALKKYEEAILDYIEVLNLNPDDFDAYYHIGLAKSCLGQNKEALIDLNQAANGFLNQNQFQQYQDCLKLIDDLKGKL